MELKLAKSSNIIVSTNGFNRTFMELKLLRVDKDPNGNFVLIVPLWN